MLGPSLLLYILYILLYISALYIFCTCILYTSLLANVVCLNTTLNKDYYILFYSILITSNMLKMYHVQN